jgi:hypothetical protein
MLTFEIAAAPNNDRLSQHGTHRSSRSMYVLQRQDRRQAVASSYSFCTLGFKITEFENVFVI